MQTENLDDDAIENKILAKLNESPLKKFQDSLREPKEIYHGAEITFDKGPDEIKGSLPFEI